MKIDLKLIFLALVVLCLVSEIDGLWGSRSGSRSRSVRSGYRSVRRMRSYRRARVRRSHRVRRFRRVRRSHRVRRFRRVRRSHRVRRFRRIRRVRRFRRIRRVRRFRRIRRVRRFRRNRRVRRFRREGWFSKSGRKIKARPPHSIKSLRGLRNLYNSKVVKVERVKRPLKGKMGKLLSYLGIKHSGVVVTTKSGKRWLVHKGGGYGVSSQTIVTEAKHMSNKWEVQKYKKVTGAKVGDYVKAGGKRYRVLTDNCNDASRRMYKLNG